MSAADLLAPDSPDTWLAGILAAADLREQRASRIGNPYPGPWRVGDGSHYLTTDVLCSDDVGPVVVEIDAEWASGTNLAEHIAAEASPAHALAAVRRWRGVVERHAGHKRQADCDYCGEGWPCPDLTETADEVRAYLGGAP